ncbi:MAG: hypothetical protein AAGK78_02365 [Planctomycetota bacterium]
MTDRFDHRSTLRVWQTAGCVAVLCVLLLAGGCARSTLRPDERPTTRAVTDAMGNELGTGTFEPRVEAFVTPPTGWEAEEEKMSGGHTHLVWLSPTGDTAYGVIYASAPFYVPATEMFHNIVLDRILKEMERDQGEANLLSKKWLGDRRIIRFEADGGLYHIRTNLQVRGRSVWCVYAGTFKGKLPREDELEIAVAAREATRVGRDAQTGEPEPAPVISDSNAKKSPVTASSSVAR